MLRRKKEIMIQTNKQVKKSVKWLNYKESLSLTDEQFSQRLINELINRR